MGEAQVAEAPPTREELSAAHKSYRERLITFFESRFASGTYKLADAEQKARLDGIRHAIGFDSMLANVVKMCESIAATTISKHLVQVAQDPNSYKAFCKKCGRHYRYHDHNTGDCPDTPFDGDAEE